MFGELAEWESYFDAKQMNRIEDRSRCVKQNLTGGAPLSGYETRRGANFASGSAIESPLPGET